MQPLDFITKPDGDNMQEHIIDRLISMIYQISMVANLNDEAFAGNSSGVALQYKLLPMKNMAANKERKFTQALRRLYRVVFSVGTVLPESDANAWQDLHFKFTRNLPVNLADEAQTASTLSGIVSKKHSCQHCQLWTTHKPRLIACIKNRLLTLRSTAKCDIGSRQ